ncbi:MAG: hypothetical protein ACUZ8E_04395 [Candidatus Anammoxibacter sp.]
MNVTRCKRHDSDCNQTQCPEHCRKTEHPHEYCPVLEWRKEIFYINNQHAVPKPYFDRNGILR